MAVSYDANNQPVTSVTVTGTDGNVPPAGTANFIVDTGANQSMVSFGTAKDGQFKIDGVVRVGTAAGAVNLLKISGHTMKFKAVPAGGGEEVDVECNIQTTLGGSNLLGTDQLAHVRCTFTTDPEAKTGSINKKS